MEHKRYKETDSMVLMAEESEAIYTHKSVSSTIVVSLPSSRNNQDNAISADELKARLHESLKSRFL